MSDISGFGLRVNLVAHNTFPRGISISQFSDDADSLDLPEITIAETAMGLNGDLISWSKASPIPLTLNVIPNQVDDNNLETLGDANRVGRGKNSAGDLITLTIVYGNGTTATLTRGKLIKYQPGDSIASSSRLKTKKYEFMFENIDVTRPSISISATIGI
ncbi:phage tail fiber protein [Vibrio harveyi]|uniref:phage tail fiber protein n=1 Tax=Vibrio harveyi TaxID=669 RepID=UPI000C7E62B5|nr:hypothetical protein [Vibrio harveyi]AWB00249.1 hypothetical protein CU052_13505 [Vibrio harveyi]GBK97746.1 hypothetical protein VH1709_contig00011-0074 [Vibrio harveyi]HDM8061702.1 hypothetical protein [Vibrio harveyi]